MPKPTEAEQPKSWAEITKEITAITKDAPWWVTILIAPTIIIVGLIFATNPGLGEILGKGFLILIRNAGATISEGAINAHSNMEDRINTLARGLYNYFADENRRTAWRRGRNWYLGTAIFFVVIGLLSHFTNLFLFIGTLMILGPLLILATILISISSISISSEKPPVTKETPVITKIGNGILYFVAIILLAITGRMFISSFVVWSMLMTLWLGIILFFNPFVKAGRGIRPAWLVLCAFIGAMLIGKVMVFAYNHYTPLQRGVDAVQYVTLGRTAKLFDHSLVEKELNERPIKQVAVNTQLWATVSDTALPTTITSQLPKGSKVIVNPELSIKDSFGSMYYQAILKDSIGGFKKGWINVRDLEPLTITITPAGPQQNSGQFSYSTTAGPQTVVKVGSGKTVEVYAENRDYYWHSNNNPGPNDPPKICNPGGTVGFSPASWAKHEEYDTSWVKAYPAPRMPFGALLVRSSPGSSWKLLGLAREEFSGPAEVQVTINSSRPQNGGGFVPIHWVFKDGGS